MIIIGSSKYRLISFGLCGSYASVPPRYGGIAGTPGSYLPAPERHLQKVALYIHGVESGAVSDASGVDSFNFGIKNRSAWIVFYRHLGNMCWNNKTCLRRRNYLFNVHPRRRLPEDQALVRRLDYGHFRHNQTDSSH